MDKENICEIFNKGFRKGANARFNNGFDIQEANAITLSDIPKPDFSNNHFELEAWRVGYIYGFKMGASDIELKTNNEPGTHGMISALSIQMMKLFGIFEEIYK